MTNLNVTAIVLVFSAGAMAAGMSKDNYNGGKATIAAEYKVARARCHSFSANARDVCMVEAKGTANVAKAELEDGYRSTRQSRYAVRIAKAQADYLVAIEKCDDKAANDKDGCIKEAKAAKLAGAADAMTLLKTANAR